MNRWCRLLNNAVAISEILQIRIHGDDSLPTLIYLPGLHGDWTLIGGFRKHLLGRVRFVEFIYPRTLDWSLEDYAANIEAALAENGINHGWLLGESYGSQIVWPLIQRGNFNAKGVVLAGGFVKHPLRWLVRFSELISCRMPYTILVWSMYAFTKYTRICIRRITHTDVEVDEFAERRTKLDIQAATHRLHLIAHNDPRSIARVAQLPIFYLSGFFDPIVPWPGVRHWLKRNCPALRACKVIFTADHNILGSASAKAARQVLAWINQPDVLRVAA